MTGCYTSNDWYRSGWNEEKQRRQEEFWRYRVLPNKMVPFVWRIFHYAKIFIFKVPEGGVYPDELILLHFFILDVLKIPRWKEWRYDYYG